MRFFLKYSCLMAVALLPGLASAALQNGKVQVGFVKGKASLLDPQANKKDLTTGLMFQEGYRVETEVESSAELILSNGSTLIVSPGTLLEVRTFRQVASELIVEGAYQKLDKEPSPSVTEIEVKRGKVLGEVRKLNPMSSYVIKTPVGVARIRGTVYSVEYSVGSDGQAKLTVGCVHGSVEATVFDSGSGPVSVGPGKLLLISTPAPGGESSGVAPGGAAPAGTPDNTTAPATLPGFQDAAGKNLTVVLDADMDAVQLKEVAAILAQSPSLPPNVAEAVSAQASLAPPPGASQPQVVTGSTTSPNASGEVAPAVASAPAPTSNGSTGGSSTVTSSVTDTLNKITETINKLVEQEQTTDPSATGG